ncbi:uncharacterized protein [Symphalangus syndactylus]|uniref:uncharacterized protein n=1 Tax=Symphalangus syndactylus TaxID=9590 RepID=UPI003003E9FE
MRLVGRSGEERGEEGVSEAEGSELNGGRGPRADAPPPVPLPFGGKASGRRRRFQNKEMRHGARGTRVERKAEETRPNPSACQLPLQPVQGSSPHHPPKLRRGRGRMAAFGGGFLFHFCRSGVEGARPLCYPAWLQCAHPRAPRPFCPGCRAVPENTQSARNVPSSRATSVWSRLPPSRPRCLSPSGQEADPPASSRGAPAALVAPAAARTMPRSRPRFLPLGVERIPGCGFSRHTFSQDLAVLPRLDSNSWAQVILLPQSPE